MQIPIGKKLRFLWQRIWPSIVLVLLVSSPTPAAQGRMLEILFQSADTNKDNLVSEQEYHAAMQKRFEQMDQNKDGRLSREEMEQARSTARTRLQSLRGSGRFAN